jgi:bla regulator protein blaR1
MSAYIIKTILCSALFILAYKLLFEKEQMLRFNRYYLLISLILTILIPLIHFEQPYEEIVALQSKLPLLNSGVDNASVTKFTESESGFSFTALILISYLLITFLLLGKAIFSISRLLRIINKHTHIKQSNYTIVLINKPINTHSFLNYIFVYKLAYELGNIESEILEHELTHIQQKHSYDLLFFEIYRAICWFNPILLIYQKSILLNHEFLADEGVLATGANALHYQHLLIDKSVETTKLAFAHQFTYQDIKKRLTMINTNTSKTRLICKSLITVPITLVAILAFSNVVISQATTPKTPTISATQALNNQQGATKEQMEEYDRILNRVITRDDRIMISDLTPDELKKLKTIYNSMLKTQINSQRLRFLPIPPPPKPIEPTEEQVKQWQNKSIYGVWIDGRRIKNDDLKKYSNTDFTYYSTSKLEKNAINYGKHFYQIDIMTHSYYKDFCKKMLNAKATKEDYIGVVQITKK